MRVHSIIVLLFAACSAVQPPRSVPRIADAYLDRYFAHYPTRATQAGHHDFDRDLERLDARDRADWIAFNEATKRELASAVPRDDDERLDALLLARHIDRELFRRGEPSRNPLVWTEIAGNSVVFLLVRDNRPADAVARARLIPRLARKAEATLTDDASPELCAMAAAQARASAEFFRTGFTQFDASAGHDAAAALDHLAAFLTSLQQRAKGSPRLGARYAESLRLTTGERDPDALLARAQHDLEAKRAEAAAYARSALGLSGSDNEVLRAAFARAEADRHTDTDRWVEYGTRLVDEAEAFTKTHDVVTLPEPRTLVCMRSPSYFTGQSVGGVYPAGPYDPDAKTLYFLPVPPDDATPEQRAAFFRDFNDHFQRMITPHEILPGHYVQLKYAAHNPHKVRAVFPDDVYVEGWGTFCERTMLDLGWGGPLDRVAHLKKQMENIARTIVDIRVHTKGMTREELTRFVTEDALQGKQLANNMWFRSISTTPQITTYYLGYVKVMQLFDDVRAARGAAFRLRDFTDELMRIGPVPLEEVRRIMVPRSSSGSSEFLGLPGPVPPRNRGTRGTRGTEQATLLQFLQTIGDQQNGETNPPCG